MRTAPAPVADGVCAPFPLVPRRHFTGVQFGERRGSARGAGSEVAGSRPYRPGDRVATIDWAASARLSAARGEDQFVVREHFAEQVPRVALVCDRRPGMALYPLPFPWLDKRAAAEAAAVLIAASTASVRGELGYADHDSWIPPGASARVAPVRRRVEGTCFDAPPYGLRAGLETLCRHRGLFPSGSFVFVVSDFLEPLPARLWMRLRASQWDVTPVVVQDPTWEQSFPDVGGVLLPLADATTGETRDVRLSAREARKAAAANEARLARTLAGFRRLRFDPILLGTAEPSAVAAAFHAWAARRKRLRRRWA